MGLGLARRPDWHCLLAALAALLLTLAPPPAICAPKFEVHIERRNDRFEVRANAILDATPTEVWETLTDYEHLPEFIPGLSKSRVLARNGGVITVEQAGEVRFLFWALPLALTVEVIERPPNLDVRLISGTLRHLQGHYEMETLADPVRVQLRWTGAIAPESELPALIGEALMRHLIRDQFAGMVREIERRSAVRRRAAPESGPP